MKTTREGYSHYTSPSLLKRQILNHILSSREGQQDIAFKFILIKYLGHETQSFRATSFPKVTKLFCRLPVSTLFY